MVEYFLAVLLVLFVVGVMIFHRLAHQKKQVLLAWKEIDAQLKHRHDLILQLVDIVSAYTNYERSTLDLITRLRTEVELIELPMHKAQLEQELSGQLEKLVAIAAGYPDLKVSKRYLDVIQQLTKVENHIQYDRRCYNSLVRDFNMRINSFPDVIIAGMFGFMHADFFDLEGKSFD